MLLHKVGLAADASTASDYTWPYQITSMVKHGAELAGWMLLATAIAAGIRGVPARAVDRCRIVALEMESVARDLAPAAPGLVAGQPSGSKDR